MGCNGELRTGGGSSAALWIVVVAPFPLNASGIGAGTNLSQYEKTASPQQNIEAAKGRPQSAQEYDCYMKFVSFHINIQIYKFQ